MGFLSRATGIKPHVAPPSGKLSNDGGHVLNKNTILRHTTPDAISPLQPGDWSSLRSAPVVPRPMYFTREASNKLAEMRSQLRENLAATKSAYKSLSKIEEMDAEVVKHHRRYQGKVADGELTKLKANARLARHLHAIRPDYARMGAGLERAEKSADRQVEALKSSILAEVQ